PSPPPPPPPSPPFPPFPPFPFRLLLPSPSPPPLSLLVPISPHPHSPSLATLHPNALEDTQPLTEPVVKPIKVKRYDHRLHKEEEDFPPTTFTKATPHPSLPFPSLISPNSFFRISHSP